MATQDIPDVDASADEWASYYGDDQNQIQTGTTMVGIGLFFYIWFLGSIRSVLSAAEGGSGRLAAAAHGGGLVSAGFFLIAVAATQAAAFRPDEIDPTITRALSDVGIMVAAPAAAGFTALFAATAIVGYRYGALPAEISGISALAAITQPFAYGTSLTDSGAFAGDGVLGLWVPIIGFVVGIVALSATLIREPAPRRAARSQ